MGLIRAGEKFRTRMRTLEGAQFMAHLLEPPLTLASNTFVQPRRMMVVGPNSHVQTGDVVLSPDQRHFIVADHGGVFVSEMVSRSYVLFEADKQLAWKRHVKVIDPVSKAEVSDAKQPMGTIYCALEPTHMISDTLKIGSQEYRLLTGSAVSQGDMIGAEERQVQHVEVMLGIYVATVK